MGHPGKGGGTGAKCLLYLRAVFSIVMKMTGPVRLTVLGKGAFDVMMVSKHYIIPVYPAWFVVFTGWFTSVALPR